MEIHMNQIEKNDVQNDVVSFVSAYEICIRKTTASILELAECVYRAKELLTAECYEEFCKQINVEKNSSYLKKLNCIAQKAARFKMIENQLPANYTTLYALTKVSDDNFNKMCENNVINPLMTAKQLSSYLDKKTVQKSAVYEVIFRFDSNKQSDDILDCMTAFEQVASEFKIELKKSPDLIATLEQEKKIGLLLSPPSLKQLMTM
jgi:hypothetical protein